MTRSDSPSTHKENSYRFSCKNVGAIMELSMGLEHEWEEEKKRRVVAVR